MDMKTFLKFHLAGLAGLLAAGGTALAKAKNSAAEDMSRPALQVRVNVPGTVDRFNEHDIAEAIANRVRETFDRRGYQGRIEAVMPGQDAKSDRPELIVNLMQWRATRTGFIECTFTAKLRNPDGSEQALGFFTGTEILWGSRRSPWDIADTFVDAADNAAGQLWSELSRRDLVPAGNSARTD